MTGMVELEQKMESIAKNNTMPNPLVFALRDDRAETATPGKVVLTAYLRPVGNFIPNGYSIRLGLKKVNNLSKGFWKQ
jgi:hypothetical protein